MADLNPIAIYSQPGCGRDGTKLDDDSYVDNQWCRYHLRKGLPRKIGGFRRMTNRLSGISRGLDVFDNANKAYTHSGWSDGLQRFIIDLNGNVSSIVDRTPAAFVADAENLWQFSQMYDATQTTTILLAHAAPNSNDLSGSSTGAVWYGNILDSTVLTTTLSPAVSGGVMALGPYAVSFGSNGVVNYSPVNNVKSGSWVSVRPTGEKLVFGLPIRAGAGNGPSGLIWGVSALVRMTFVGGGTVWNFDEITTQYSILSSQGVIEYDGIFYWPGIDHFLSFNGVIQEVENGMNQDWFYDNLNYAQSQKVFAMKVPRYGEIWWCYPRDNATECTHAIIYNVRLSKIMGKNIWYDTELPNGGRSAAQYARVFRRPIMAGIELDIDTSGYKLWEHEFQFDEIDGTEVSAIRSYFETANFWLANIQPPINNAIYVEYIEPNFVQTGEMSVQIKGSMSNARAPENSSIPKTFPAVATTTEEQVVYMEEQRRQLRFKFESNVAGGFYQHGRSVAQTRPGDGKITS